MRFLRCLDQGNWEPRRGKPCLYSAFYLMLFAFLFAFYLEKKLGVITPSAGDYLRQGPKPACVDSLAAGHAPHRLALSIRRDRVDTPRKGMLPAQM